MIYLQTVKQEYIQHCRTFYCFYSNSIQDRVAWRKKEKRITYSVSQFSWWGKKRYPSHLNCRTATLFVIWWVPIKLLSEINYPRHFFLPSPFSSNATSQAVRSRPESDSVQCQKSNHERQNLETAKIRVSLYEIHKSFLSRRKSKACDKGSAIGMGCFRIVAADGHKKHGNLYV